ncbi:MAG: hypothetical protein XE05_1409 [Thermotogales bacterium 46_20]|nr:MAG: hypothetical protein XE05_1409 [Thermotogales bacterium 46_20]
MYGLQTTYEELKQAIRTDNLNHDSCLQTTYEELKQGISATGAIGKITACRLPMRN